MSRRGHQIAARGLHDLAHGQILSGPEAKKKKKTSRWEKIEISLQCTKYSLFLKIQTGEAEFRAV